MGPRLQKLTLCAGLALAALLLAFCANTARQVAHWTVVDEAPEARAKRLAEHWSLVLPEGQGPHPAAILVSGCDGVRDNMHWWAEEFVHGGRAVLVVDSHTPRGLDRLDSWRLVCAGQALTGAERAGDIAVALEVLARTEGIDDDVVILGASHGGWAAMEFVDQAILGAVPPGLEAWPEPPTQALARISAMVLLYPYCGVLNAAEHWTGAPPVLMILAQKDSIVRTPACVARAEALRRGGAVVETAVIAGADHAFDQREKAPFSTLGFDAAQRDEARDLATNFLATNAR